MDEFDRGIDPQLKKYFSQILNSLTWLVLWFTIMATLGLYLRWAFPTKRMMPLNIIFYVLLAISFIWLMRKLYGTWIVKK